MTRQWIGALLLVGVLVGCGGDDSAAPSGAVACPSGTAENTTVACTCADGVSLGTGLCQGGFIGLCNCAPVGMGTGGAMPPVMTGSTGGTTPPAGGTGSTSPIMGSGGTGGMMMSMDDGGVDPDVDGGAGSGAQGSACAASTDCDNGLACYNNNFCSKSCTRNADCSGIAGGKTYTCYMMRMVCRIDCMANGDADCPTGFTCQDVTGGVRRCQLP